MNRFVVDSSVERDGCLSRFVVFVVLNYYGTSGKIIIIIIIIIISGAV